MPDRRPIRRCECRLRGCSAYPSGHEYGAGPKVYHVDLYRLEHMSEAARLGLDELFDREAIVLIEWGERFPALLPAGRIEIRIEAGQGDEREITVSRIAI